MIIGSLLFWISGFAMYGFGELVDKTASIDKKLSELLRRSNAKKRNVSDNTSKENEPSSYEKYLQY